MSRFPTASTQTSTWPLLFSQVDRVLIAYRERDDMVAEAELRELAAEAMAMSATHPKFSRTSPELVNRQPVRGAAGDAWGL